MHRSTVRTSFPQLLCPDPHDATLLRTRHPDDLLFEATTPTFFLYLALRWAVDNQLVRPTASSAILACATPECLKVADSLGHATHRLIQISVSTISHNATFTTGKPPRSMFRGLLDLGVVGCGFFVPSNVASGSFCSSCRTTLGATFKLRAISPSKSDRAVTPKSSCSTPSGTRNHNLNRIAESAVGLTALCLCFTPTYATHIAETAQIPDIVYLIPQSDDGSLHLSGRDTHDSHDARWRGMVIGSTIGSTAGAAFLGIGIYLLFRARRRRTGDLSRSESQPIEMQPTRSSCSRSLNVPQGPRSRPPPRAQTHETSGGPSSWAAKTPRMPSLASLEQPRLLHPRDISRATHIRASTGSQFTEHFEPVLGTHRHLSGGPPTEEGSQSPGITPRHFQGSSDPQGSGEPAELNIISVSTPEQPRERFESPQSNSQMTAPLPPGAAAPVESVGNYTPPEASNTHGPRIRLS